MVFLEQIFQQNQSFFFKVSGVKGLMYAFVLNKVVGDAFLLFGSGNRRSDIHFFVALPRVAGNDLGFKMLGKGYAQGGFTHSRRTSDIDQSFIRHR
jgi:hypothetical protein